MSTRGILIVANGPENEARSKVLVSTLQRLFPDVAHKTVYDSACSGFQSRHYKTRLPWHSPFKETLFLDTDIIAMKDFTRIWDRLKDSDLWMAMDSHPSLGLALLGLQNAAHAAEKIQTAHLCANEQTYFNTGVILFRNTVRVRTFFEQWHAQWLKYQTIDQLAAARAMKITSISPHILPTCYNRPGGYAHPGIPSDTVFLHCWSLPLRDYPTHVREFLRSRGREDILGHSSH